MPNKNLNSNQKSKLKSEKSWWVHLWKGLVFDNVAKHYRAMRQAIWLYLYLLLVVNRKTGITFRRISTIEKETGFHPRTIQRWLKILRDNDYIKTKSNGRSLDILITKWRPITQKDKKRK